MEWMSSLLFEYNNGQLELLCIYQCFPTPAALAFLPTSTTLELLQVIQQGIIYLFLASLNFLIPLLFQNALFKIGLRHFKNFCLHISCCLTLLCLASKFDLELELCVNHRLNQVLIYNNSYPELFLHI